MLGPVGAGSFSKRRLTVRGIVRWSVAWDPPARPAWVEAVNRGEVLPVNEVADLPLTRDGLIGEARANLGCDRDEPLVWAFAGDDWLEPLDLLLGALSDEARLTVVGRWLTRRFLLRFLEVRLQIAAYVRADPGVRDEVIDEPWFVTGAPRTGTTILHLALSADPGHRAPEGWELLRPVPPPSPDSAVFAADSRIAIADRELRGPSVVVDGLDAIHHYGGRMAKECLSAMSFSFRSEEFVSRYHVPTYRDWLDDCDMTPAYEMHRLVLQILQRQFSGVHWVLKSPVHLHSLPVLLKVYPDARIAVTHRDPLTVLASVTSLIANLRWAHSDDVDFAGIGCYHARRYRADLDQLVDLSTSVSGNLSHAGGRVHHSRYYEFMGDPVGTVASLYAHFDRPFSGDVRQSVADALRSRPQDQHGTHFYSFADLGLDSASESANFANYSDHFGVPIEHRVGPRR